MIFDDVFEAHVAGMFEGNFSTDTNTLEARESLKKKSEIWYYQKQLFLF